MPASARSMPVERACAGTTTFKPGFRLQAERVANAVRGRGDGAVTLDDAVGPCVSSATSSRLEASRWRAASASSPERGPSTVCLYWLMQAIKQDPEHRAAGRGNCDAFRAGVRPYRRPDPPGRLHRRCRSAHAPHERRRRSTSRARPGSAVGGLAEAFERLQPDIVVLLGDRFETLAAATAAALMRIPIAHIHGGEISEGAIDDALRHAITKLSHLHFVAAEPFRAPRHPDGRGARARVHGRRAGPRQPGSHAAADRAAVRERVGLDLDRPMFLVTYHPATLDEADPLPAVEELLAALDRFPDAALVFTKANADPGGRAINARLESYVGEASGPRRADRLARAASSISPRSSRPRS